MARSPEFFEKLLEVPRLGPMSALRALIIPVAEIARAIELQDETFLKKLPGVARQRARDMIATLQGKLAAFVDALRSLRLTVNNHPEVESSDELVRLVFQQR